jgi:tRNA (guanine26-N2/guanine27-N2)-dimethyltransferase
MLKLVKIKEGETSLWVPDLRKYGIPQHAPVFYNPLMSHDRSVSVEIAKKYAGRRKMQVADIMCGIGARAVRYANECGKNFQVYANDAQPSAIKISKRNARLNKVKIEFSNAEANKFLSKFPNDRFDYIDIDPFGSPSHFINSAMQAIKPKKSMLGITATDVGALSGVYPEAGFRKYSTVSGMTSFKHELGIRNLIFSVFREAAKYEYGIKPLYSYYNLHYYRIFIQIGGNKRSVNRSFGNVGHISYCPNCERREYHPLFESLKQKCECKKPRKILGPTWIHKLGDLDFLLKSNKIDNQFEYEIESPYYDLHALATVLGKKPAKTFDTILKLRELGYKAEKTHFAGFGIKTNAPYEEIKRAAK